MPKRLPPTSRSLPIALIRARETVMAPIRQMLIQSGITEQQWRILRILAEDGPMDSSTLAHRASLLRPSVTRIVHSMTQRGLLQQLQDEEDRRRLILTIAPEGQRIIDDNLEQALAIAARWQDRLGHKRYDALLDLLADLAE